MSSPAKRQAREYTLFASALAACLCACGCGRGGSRPASPGVIEDQPAEAVNGLRLSLAQVRQPDSAHDGKLALEFQNVGERPRRIILGLDVNGHPSVDGSVLMRVADADGRTLTSDVSLLAYVGAFKPCVVPLAPGSRYRLLVPGDLRHYLNHVGDPSLPPRPFRVVAAYMAGVKVTLDNGGRAEVRRDPAESNELVLQGRYPPLDDPHYAATRARHEAEALEVEDLWGRDEGEGLDDDSGR